MADLDCPICMDAIYRIDLSEQVCEEHQEFFVIICQDCGRKAFSDNRAFCWNCEPITLAEPTRGSGDHRAQLRNNGMEGWD